VPGHAAGLHPDVHRRAGYAPTFTEIAEACGYRSLSTVHEHVQNLERKGHITRQFNAERGIALVEAPAAEVVS
jgi:repressor LexA